MSIDPVLTYYVYDDMGQLRYVVPPIAADSLPTGTITDDNGVLKRYAYLYKYDERGNIVVKRLPGCDSICMVYDKTDRLVMSQDGNQRLKNKWTVTKYDLLGRVLYTGIIIATSTQNRVYFKNILDSQVVAETYDQSSTFYNTGYTCTGSLIGIIPLTVNYYDNYSFRKLQTAIDTTKIIYTTLAGYDSQYLNSKGLLTGTRTYILDNSGSYLATALYYDDRGRVVQSRSSNQLGGYDMAYNHYDFTGRVLIARKEHNTASQPAFIPEVNTYDYDPAGRLKTNLYQLNSKPAILLVDQSQANSYDELGRLIMKKRHGGTDTENYGYNIRNWATNLKSGNFSETLYYNSNLPSGATACYNGNIAASTWTYNSSVYTYPYMYDQMNRLTSASGGSCNGNMEYFTYDKQGNIKTLQRFKSYSPIDFLTMTYSGNQTKAVADQYGSQNQVSVKEYQNDANVAIEFNYDKNGNMVKDKDRNIVAIRYNILNLPDTIQFVNGNQILNRYAANGQKLETEYFTKIVPIVIPIDKDTVYKWTYSSGLVNQVGMMYIDDLEYQIYSGNLQNPYLLRVHNEEGYADNVTINPYGPYYYYFRKDHLGTNREVWRAAYSINGTVTPAATLQQTQYYPSGLPWASNTTDNPSLQPFKYNGKQFDEMNGLDTYDYGARGYYPAMGRFMTVDPLAEKYYSISPYAYCAGNPVNAIDPDGMDDYILTRDGKTVLALKTLGKQDRLFALDKSGSLSKDNKGNIKREMVSDKKLLPQLSQGGEAETSKTTDAFNVFKFSADNTDVEWHLKGYDTKNDGMGFLLNTSNSYGSVSDIDGSYEPSNLVFDLHSHPPGTNDQGPSGWITKLGNDYRSDNFDDDCRNLIIHSNINAATRHYIYHEGTKQLIYYDINTAANKNTQKGRGVSLGIIKSAILMRTMILH